MKKNNNLVLYFIGPSIINTRIWDTIKKSICTFYKMGTHISLYTPVLNLLSYTYRPYSTFNNSYTLRKLLHPTAKRIQSGASFLARVHHKKRNYTREIFIKEIPLVPYNFILRPSEQGRVNYSCAYQNELSKYVYNVNSSGNIEIFISYFVSRLTELDISPHFCKIFGCYSTTMRKFTYPLDDEDCDNSIYNKVKRGGEVCVVKSNVPIYLLALEKFNYELSDAVEGIKSAAQFYSIIFQIFAALVCINHNYKIYHNDIHIGNIFLQKTAKTHLYYSVGGTLYKIPTFGYIIKIIDWGRATYSINSIQGKNLIFNNNSLCEGQYRYSTLYKEIPNELGRNKWMDIVIASHSMLYSYGILRQYPALFKKLYSLLKTTNGVYISIKSFNWNIYEHIGNSTFDITPEVLFETLFEDFTVDTVLNNKVYRII